MLISQKIRIYPNKTVQKQFEEWFDYRRFNYNRALRVWNEMYNDGENPTERRVRDKIKRELKEDWGGVFSPNILDNAIADLGSAWNNYFIKISRRPRFKRKKDSLQTLTFNRKNDSTIRFKNGKLLLPKIKYPVKLSESLRFDGIIKMCTITRQNQLYFACINMEVDEDYFRRGCPDGTVGVDLNIGHFDISEESHRYDFPKEKLKFHYNRVNYYQRSLSKKKRNSNKRKVVKAKLLREYYRISCIRKDWLQKFTTRLIDNYHTICIEDLNVKGMLKNRHLSKHISGSMFGSFREIIQYKCDMYGNKLVVADKWFPSTQTCSSCGNVKKGDQKLKLSDRKYHCDCCNKIIDRDFNSACNLKIYAEGVGYTLMT